MLFRKLFFTSLSILFFFANIGSSSYSEVIDESLIGDKVGIQQKDFNNAEPVIAVPNIATTGNNSIESSVSGYDNTDGVENVNQQNSVADEKSKEVVLQDTAQQATEQININTTAKEVFKEQIEKAKNVSNLKVINKVKYGSDIADEVENRDEHNRGEKVVVNRTTMKKKMGR